MEYFKKNKNYILLTAFVMFISYIPFMNDFLLYGHDIGFHLGRIEGLAISISNGDFLGRINPVNGYGSASGIMYPQLFIYIPAFLRLLGFPLIDVYKWFILSINLATFVIAYISFKNILRLDEKYIAMSASAFYVLGLYRLTTIYRRAAIGEILGMTFLPLLFWGMYELFAGDKKKWWVAVLGWTCVLQSHVLTAEMALVFSILFLLVEIKKILCEGRWKIILKAAVLTVLLNAFFIVPFIQYFTSCDFQVFHMEPDEFVRSAVYFSQMFSVFVDNSGVSLPLGSTAGEMPCSIGLITLITLAGYVMLRFNTANKRYKVGDKIFLLAVFILLAASDLWPWGVLYRFPALYRIVSSVQLLFRLFSPAYFFITAIFVIDLGVLKDYVKEPVLVLLSLMLILGNCWYYIDSTVQTENVLSKEETEQIVSIDGLYLYNDFASLEKLYEREDTIRIIPAESGLSVGEYVKQGSYMAFDVSGSGSSAADLEIPLYYYPTYRAQLNGEELELEQGTDGVIRIKNVSQSGMIKVWFPELPLWVAADIISLCTALVCVAMIVRNKLIRRAA